MTCPAFEPPRTCVIVFRKKPISRYEIAFGESTMEEFGFI